MGLDDAMRRVAEQDALSSGLAAERGSEDARIIAEIRTHVTELSAEAIAWLSDNPRARTALGVLPPSGRNIVVRHTGWVLGHFFLSEGGQLTTFHPQVWFPPRVHKPLDWDARVAAMASELGVGSLLPFNTRDDRYGNVPRYTGEACRELNLVARPSNLDYSGPGEVIYMRDGEVRTSGPVEPLSDQIAKALLALKS